MPKLLLLCNWKQNQAFYLLLDYGLLSKQSVYFLMSCCSGPNSVGVFLLLFLSLLTTLGTEGTDCSELLKMVLWGEWLLSTEVLCLWRTLPAAFTEQSWAGGCSCEAMPTSLSALLLLGMTPRMFPVIFPTLWPSVLITTFPFISAAWGWAK